MSLKILGSAGTSPSSGCPIYRVQCTECGDVYRRVGWPWDIKRQSHCVRCNGSSKRKPGTVNSRRRERRAELRKCPPVACDAVRSANRASGSGNANGERVGACKTGKICLLCGSMPHRVEGATCRRCGLAFAEEAPLELELRQFDDIRGRV